MKKLLPLALAGALGCVHFGKQDVARVSDEDAGRLGPEQVSLVNRARQDLDAAKDALSRARLGVEQAKNEQGTAKAEGQAAQADQKVADAQRKVAGDSRAPDAVERARTLQAVATASRESAALHGEYAKRLLDLRGAEAKVAERRVDLEQARVEWSKLQALEAAGNPAATKYEASRFQAAVNAAQKSLDAATGDARGAEAEARPVRQRWDALQRRVPRDPQGTGSGR